MALRIKLFAPSALAAALLLPLVALAQDPAPTGDPAKGEKIAYTCNGCHAIPNYKNVYPTYDVPMLHGQRPQYLVAALKAYKSGERSHGTMHSQASSLSEQDMIDVAAYLAGPTVLSESKNDVPATARPKASETCLACHGTNGVGITADYPTLAGQHKDYIERALHDYQKGGRKNPIMAGMAATLTHEDIEQLAEYYSHQTPSLTTLPKKRFWFSSDPLASPGK
ncbi:MAG TPA: c-type cytochrome [Steroidobacteraceae bacterium]|nr:c-type cytochrome [Steroidobacteraceae bacterium]